MPITPPAVDNRRYQQLVDEALARARVHTPEWTNFSQSDPGVTLVQLSAFLAESVLYRANLVPERNRAKFLQLLGVPLATATPATGLVTFANERGPAATLTLPADLDVRAGPILFRTETGLDVLPLETRVYLKRGIAQPSATLIDYYRLLYASYGLEMPGSFALYETVAFDGAVISTVDLSADTVDGALWIALLGRRDDIGTDTTDPWKQIRDQLGGRTLSLGIMPATTATDVRRTPSSADATGGQLIFELPRVGNDRRLVASSGQPAPTYRQIESRGGGNTLTTPSIVELVLPPADEIGTWENLQPLESGVGDLPPAIEDNDLAGRVISWLRVRAQPGSTARLLWVGINAVRVRQHQRVVAEPLAAGDGSADQQRRLAHPPVLPGSITMTTETEGQLRRWQEIDDLMAAGPEVPAADNRQPPGTAAGPDLPTDVFLADHEAGLLTFGDGLRGRRLPFGARVFATYEFCQGAAGNVAAGAINSAPTLPSSIVVTNPVRTWGGADAESITDGEKQVRRYLQHRDRLVSVADFRSIGKRTPGVDIGRIDVLPAFHPDLTPIEPGVAPGVVTLLVIPRSDPQQPDAPRADKLFLDAICRYLAPRRLVTTELIIAGPVYKRIWISVGIDVAAGFAIVDVTDSVAQRLRRFLSPIPPEQGGSQEVMEGVFVQEVPASSGGWPLRTAVSARVLLAEAARVPGVLAVESLQLAEEQLAAADEIAMEGLELPQILGISVVAGEAQPIDVIRGAAAGDSASEAGDAPVRLQVPVVPEAC